MPSLGERLGWVPSSRQTEHSGLVSNAWPSPQLTGSSTGSRPTAEVESQQAPGRSDGDHNNLRRPVQVVAAAAARYGRGALALLDKGNPFKGIERFGISFFETATHYIVHDLFTTLLNAPTSRFLVIFVIAYLSMYFVFAVAYVAFFPGYCMMEPGRSFSHAFWFSFQTASTIGYAGDSWPNPDCGFFNTVAMLEVILANLLDYCLMGLVFARFSAPLPKAKAIRFTKNMVLFQRDPRDPASGGHWVLSFRLANIRKHSLLKPEICLLLAMPEANSNPASSSLKFVALQVEDITSIETNIKLGLPGHVDHVVLRDSPLWGLSLDEMEERGLELFCFMDGIDPMTSNSVQARNQYKPADIRMSERFGDIGLQQNWRGHVGLDFSQFDTTVPAGGMTREGSYGGPVDDEFYFPTASMTMPAATTPASTMPALTTASTINGARLVDISAGGGVADPELHRQYATRLRARTLGALTIASAAERARRQGARDSSSSGMLGIGGYAVGGPVGWKAAGGGRGTNGYSDGGGGGADHTGYGGGYGGDDTVYGGGGAPRHGSAFDAGSAGAPFYSRAGEASAASGAPFGYGRQRPAWGAEAAPPSRAEHADAAPPRAEYDDADHLGAGAHPAPRGEYDGADHLGLDVPALPLTEYDGHDHLGGDMCGFGSLVVAQSGGLTEPHHRTRANSGDAHGGDLMQPH
ncbi:hypothetical protein FOA52_007004 [Chlamydomonas sp. UWO 241]|nr:hypothetical protein FOA52_007004 [Chlamydomonas sp. UWO 241]